jgi:hypothetical protein
MAFDLGNGGIPDFRPSPSFQRRARDVHASRPPPFPVARRTAGHHSELSEISILEEAQYHGIEAAKYVLAVCRRSQRLAANPRKAGRSPKVAKNGNRQWPER